MNKQNIIKNKNFSIYIKEEKPPIHLSFAHNPAATYTFELTLTEWKNLIKFLKETISNKNYIFWEFDIKKNKYDGESLKKHKAKIILMKKLFGDRPTELKRYLHSERKTKKYYLYDYISLKKDKASANLERKKFIQFRKFCLENKNKVKIA